MEKNKKTVTKKRLTKSTKPKPTKKKVSKSTKPIPKKRVTKVNKPKQQTKQKPKLIPPKKTTKKPVLTKVIKQRGGENIGYIAGDLFKSFFNLGKEVFNEIDSLTKLPQQLSATPPTKVTTQPSPPVVYNKPSTSEEEYYFS